MKYANNVDKTKLIMEAKELLKGVNDIAAPEWATYVKTGVSKQRPPMELDWWHIRAASVLVKVSELGPIGVEKLRNKYGSKKRRGHKPAEFRPASGNILRKILQQLGKAELVEYKEKDVHKGRVITGKGKSLLDKAAKELIAKEK